MLTPVIFNHSSLMQVTESSREQRILGLLDEFSEVFSGDISKPISGHSVHIPVKEGDIPIFRKYYTIPFQLGEAVQN